MFSSAGTGEAVLLLMFAFGGWFGARLARQGHTPEHPGRAAAILTGLAFGSVLLGLGVMAILGGPESAFPEVVFVNAAIYTVLAVIGYRVWPALGRWTLAYGALARVPVIVVTVIAVPAAWGTHYEKVGPGDGVPMDTVPRILALCFAQVFVWIPWTLLFGGATGAFAAWLVKRRDGK